MKYWHLHAKMTSKWRHFFTKFSRGGPQTPLHGLLKVKQWNGVIIFHLILPPLRWSALKVRVAWRTHIFKHWSINHRPNILNNLSAHTFGYFIQFSFRRQLLSRKRDQSSADHETLLYQLFQKNLNQQLQIYILVYTMYPWSLQANLFMWGQKTMPMMKMHWGTIWPLTRDSNKALEA